MLNLNIVQNWQKHEAARLTIWSNMNNKIVQVWFKSNWLRGLSWVIALSSLQKPSDAQGLCIRPWLEAIGHAHHVVPPLLSILPQLFHVLCWRTASHGAVYVTMKSDFCKVDPQDQISAVINLESWSFVKTDLPFTEPGSVLGPIAFKKVSNILGQELSPDKPMQYTASPSQMKSVLCNSTHVFLGPVIDLRLTESPLIHEATITLSTAEILTEAVKVVKKWRGKKNRQ